VRIGARLSVHAVQLARPDLAEVREVVVDLGVAPPGLLMRVGQRAGRPVVRGALAAVHDLWWERGGGGGVVRGFDLGDGADVRCLGLMRAGLGCI